MHDSMASVALMHFDIVNVLQCVCGAYAFCQCIITVIVMIPYIYKASFLTGAHSVLQLLTTVTEML